MAKALAITTLIISIALAVAIADPYKEEDADRSHATPIRALAQYIPRAREVAMTCDRFPRVCQAKGSPGQDCCRKRCVNVLTDNLNCGQCGRKCRYGETCCSGNCVRIMYDIKNCGGCKKRCKKGSFCQYGMCSYA